MSLQRVFHDRAIIGQLQQPTFIPFRLPLDANTVGLWSFQENKGSILYDQASGGHNGNIVVPSWSLDPIFGSVLLLDGAWNHVNVFSYGLSGWGSSSWSLEVLAYFIAGKKNGYLIDMNANHGSLIYGYQAGDTVEFFTPFVSGADLRPTSSIPIPATGWYYITYAYSAGSWRGYRNGTQIFSQNLTTTLTAATQVNQLTFGCARVYDVPSINDGWVGYSFGALANVRISNSARSAAEILSNAQRFGLA